MVSLVEYMLNGPLPFLSNCVSYRFISIFPVVVAQVVGVERLSGALGLLYFGNVVGKYLFPLFSRERMGCHHLK